MQDVQFARASMRRQADKEVRDARWSSYSDIGAAWSGRLWNTPQKPMMSRRHCLFHGRWQTSPGEVCQPRPGRGSTHRVCEEDLTPVRFDVPSSGEGTIVRHL